MDQCEAMYMDAITSYIINSTILIVFIILVVVILVAMFTDLIKHNGDTKSQLEWVELTKRKPEVKKRVLVETTESHALGILRLEQVDGELKWFLDRQSKDKFKGYSFDKVVRWSYLPKVK